ncbi:hypothetical protein SteCoe_11509 [Stentor coeruleus]|uniref:Tubulin beta chain n=1 Tax=Stentor coeruleus TaxID=5963 RepID=A0A1R2CD15_9CILI|nr:hypothetical protein SteCoe_11509 [Stentor coeruleus]
MKEIIPLHIGNCGTSMGLGFWENLNSEPISEYSHIYYHESSSSNYTPRCIFANTNIISHNLISQSSNTFNPQNIFYQDLNTKTFPQGHYTKGPEIIINILDLIRKEAEKCSSLQGFQIMHSLAGGCGSGLGTLILSKLKEEFPDKTCQNFTVLTSKKVSDCLFEPYNEILGYYQLSQNSDYNEALFSICYNYLKINNVTYKEMNALRNQAIVDCTISYRNPGIICNTLKRTQTELVPFPNLHFISLSIAPVYYKDYIWGKNVPCDSLIFDVFNKRNLLCECNLDNGKILNATIVVRGNGQKCDLVEGLRKVRLGKNRIFADWVPDNLNGIYNDSFRVNAYNSAVLAANTTAISEVFKRMLNNFSCIYGMRIFLRGYTVDGMDEMEFEEADCALRELIEEYSMINCM